MDSENLKRSILWRKKLSEIPCFRNSYLYGISSGIAAGLLYFMFTSKVRMSSHIAVTVFGCTTLSYWAYCRYKWESDENTAALMKEFLRNKISKEGTEKEDELPIYNVSNTKNA